MANRGGTCRASAFCFATTVFAMQFFNALASNAKNMKRLLTLNNARAVFTNASTAVVNASRFCDLPISNVAQTTQTLSSLSGRF